MKVMPDPNRREVIYEVGDYVYLKLQPYRQTTITFRSFLKITPRFYGLYEVSARVGPLAYKLEFPIGSQIHDVFHISLPKPKLESVTPVSSTLPSMSDNSTVMPQPKFILNNHLIRKGNYCPKTEILVQWKEAPHSKG